jgi:radical SAM superfamily enzyme YgiQ (UPF0313 family)
MAKLDILFVKPGSQKQLYGNLSAFKLTAIEPPLWGALLAGFMREKGYTIDLADAEVEGWSYEETARKIADADATLTVIVASGSNPSASTMNMTGIRHILTHLKDDAPELTTVIFGLHPSALPQRTMEEEPTDFVIQGEGFHTLPALIDAIKSGKPTKDIPGLWQRDGEAIVPSTIPPLCENLDELPRSAWDLLPMADYRAHNWHCFDNIHNRTPYAVIYTSLGCPFRCTFCCINALFGKNTIRYRSAKSVVEEIDFLVENWGVRNIKIMDEMFAMNEKRTVELCDAIIDRGHDLNFWSYARVNTVTPLMLKKMKQAGVNWVGYGFESGDPEVLKGVSKGYDANKVAEIVKMTEDAGLYIGANFIFGLPDDTLDSMQRTLDMAIDINAELANFYCTMAYPGSQLYDEALEKGWPLPETWQGYSQYAYDALPLPTKYLSGPEVLAFRDKAFKGYFSRPEYLAKIRKTFGADTEEHVANMLKTDLKRKYLEEGSKE